MIINEELEKLQFKLKQMKLESWKFIHWVPHHSKHAKEKYQAMDQEDQHCVHHYSKDAKERYQAMDQEDQHCVHHYSKNAKERYQAMDQEDQHCVHHYSKKLCMHLNIYGQKYSAIEKNLFEESVCKYIFTKRGKIVGRTTNNIKNFSY